MKKVKVSAPKPQAKLKGDDLALQKKIAKLEAKIIKLTANNTKLEDDLAKSDIENSNLRIDKKRLERRVNFLESELSKYEPIDMHKLDKINDAALKKMTTGEITDAVLARIQVGKTKK